MMRFAEETFHRLIQQLNFTKTRYLYEKFNTDSRLTGLVGARGTGKTTLMLQYIKHKLYNSGKCFYFSADLVYFQNTSLIEYVTYLHENQGYEIIFIDEIHKYKSWNQELKNIYDSFPKLKIVFSGSSMLDLVLGSHDLSRRAKLFKLCGLSFREYLNFVLDLDLKKIDLSDLLEDPEKIFKLLTNIERPFFHFENYLKSGYYPFVFEDPFSFNEKLTRIIDKSIFEDIANFYNLKTQNLLTLKKILVFLASIPPGDLSIHSLSKNLGIDHKTCEHYLYVLTTVALTRDLYPLEGGGPLLRHPSKYVLHNTSLLTTLNQFQGLSPSKGMTREIFFLQSFQGTDTQVYHSKEGDYKANGCTFEIGGKSKSRQQIKNLSEPAYLVKDDILWPIKGELPLFYFGFLY